MSKEANPLPNKMFETEKRTALEINPELDGEIRRNRASAAMNRMLRHGRLQKREGKLSFFKRFRISL